ncbi:MAG: energy-coupling factor transporter transmembrane component T family protein, partial [Thermodesulfovibrionales bacterium]
MSSKTARMNFIDRGLESLQEIKNLIGAPLEDSPLRRLTPGIKIAFTFSIIFLAGITNKVSLLLILSMFLFCLSLTGRLNLSGLYRRVFVITFFFGALLSLPGAINLFVEGNLVLRLMKLSRSYDFWIYHIPEEIGFTAQGIERMALLTMRVFNSVTAVFILLRTTSFEEIMLTLKKLKIPWPFLMILMLSYRYILIFAKVVEDFYLAKRARFIGRLDSTMVQNWISGRIYFLFKKTMVLGEEITLAMKARATGGPQKIPRFFGVQTG